VGCRLGCTKYSVDDDDDDDDVDVRRAGASRCGDADDDADDDDARDARASGGTSRCGGDAVADAIHG